MGDDIPEEEPEAPQSAAEDSAEASDEGELPVLGCAPAPSPEEGAGTAGEATAEAPAPVTRAIVQVQIPGLAAAAWEGRVHEVRHLLKQRADPNTFEAHMGGATRLTPLMAATAGGRVDVVAALLVAGADPELPSASGVVAGDLAENDNKGKRISKLLAVFRTEIDTQLAAGIGSGTAPASPGESSAAAVVARREAVAKVQQRGLALVEKALLGYSMLCSDTGDDDGDIALAGPEGEAARKARKQRQEEKDAVRQQKVAERVAARRLSVEETDDARLKRVAEKAAARRANAKDPEEEERERLKRVAEKAAARRIKQAELEEAKGKKEEARLKRLAEKASDREKAREMRAAVVGQVQHDHLADTSQKPVKRKVVEADVILCNSCGESSARLKCGRCGQMGMCTYCSKCCLCGTVSGFAAKVARASVPGQWRV